MTPLAALIHILLALLGASVLMLALAFVLACLIVKVEQYAAKDVSDPLDAWWRGDR